MPPVAYVDLSSVKMHRDRDDACKRGYNPKTEDLLSVN